MTPLNAGRDTLLFLLLVVLPFGWASARLYRHDQHGISNTTFRAAFRRYRVVIATEAVIFALVLLGVLLAQGQPLLRATANAGLCLALWIGVNMLVIGKFNGWK
jgi:hypothetical protein